MSRTKIIMPTWNVSSVLQAGKMQKNSKQNIGRPRLRWLEDVSDDLHESERMGRKDEE
jgi:hypothetical protein